MKIDIYEFYIKGLKNDKYLSNNYNLQSKTVQGRELEKAFYIKDKKEQLKVVRKLIKNEDYNDIKLIQDADIDRFKLHLLHNDNANFDKEIIKNKSMIVGGCISKVSNKRLLEIECYVQEIFNEAERLIDEDLNKAINYITDKQFEYHKRLFDNEYSDIKYSSEYNELIFDLLQIKKIEISNIEVEPIDETLKRIVKKPLKWNADKNTIGTLFGLLHNAKIVTGTKEDLIRGLTSLFDNLKASTLKDNINLKVNTTDNKILYDVETETMLKDWIKTLKQQNTKSTTN